MLPVLLIIPLLAGVAHPQGAEPGDRVLLVCGEYNGLQDTDEHPSVGLKHVDDEAALVLVSRLVWLDTTEMVRSKYGYHFVIPDEDTERVLRAALRVLDHPLLSWDKAKRVGATTGDEATDAMLNACRSYVDRDYAECIALLRKHDLRDLHEEWMRALVLQLRGACCEEIATAKPGLAAPWLEEAEGVYKRLCDRGFNDAFRLHGHVLLGELYYRKGKWKEADREWKAILDKFQSRTRWPAFKWAELRLPGYHPEK